MKKLIENNKKILITILITAISCISGTVFAVTQIFASEITFVPSQSNKDKGFTDTNVQDAINTLYAQSYNYKLGIITSDRLIKNTSFGDRLSSRTNTLSLKAGNYLISTFNILGVVSNSYISKNSSYTLSISSSNCSELDTDSYTHTASVKSGNYMGSINLSKTWFCSFDSDTNVTVSNSSSVSDSSLSEYFKTIAIKIG